jgi:hypothetical protein
MIRVRRSQLSRLHGAGDQRSGQRQKENRIAEPAARCTNNSLHESTLNDFMKVGCPILGTLLPLCQGWDAKMPALLHL